MDLRRRELLLIGAVATAAAAAGGVVGALALQSRSGAGALLSAAFADLSGEVRPIWNGRTPFLCNFWATWCAPCREELPLLEAAYRKLAANGLQIAGIAIDNAAKVREYLKSVPVTYAIYVADPSAIALMRDLGNASGGLPFTVGLDGAGRVQHRKLGAYTEAELNARLASLLR